MAQSYPGLRSADDLGRIFFKMVTSQNHTWLSYVLPTNAVFQEVSPEETSGKSIQELESLKSLVRYRLICNLDTIITFLKDQNIDFNKLTYVQTKAQALPHTSPLPLLHGLEIKAQHNEQSYLFRLLSVLYQERWYLIEIVLVDAIISSE